VSRTTAFALKWSQLDKSGPGILFAPQETGDTAPQVLRDRIVGHMGRWGHRNEIDPPARETRFTTWESIASQDVAITLAGSLDDPMRLWMIAGSSRQQFLPVNSPLTAPESRCLCKSITETVLFSECLHNENVFRRPSPILITAYSRRPYACEGSALKRQLDDEHDGFGNHRPSPSSPFPPTRTPTSASDESSRSGSLNCRCAGLLLSAQWPEMLLRSLLRSRM
jgi:hypothetical protein